MNDNEKPMRPDADKIMKVEKYLPGNRKLVSALPETFRMTITPEAAKAIREINWFDNRLKHQTDINKYTTDIRAGAWKCTSTPQDPIIFDRNGWLKNGQHRMDAVIRADKAIEVWVSIGADPEDFMVYDNGKARNAGDCLNGDKIANKPIVIALARIAYAIENSTHPLATCIQGKANSCKVNGKKKDFGTTRDQCVGYVKEHEEILMKCANYGKRMYSQANIGGPTTYALWAWLQFWLGNSERLDAFVNAWTNPNGQAGYLVALQNKFLKATYRDQTLRQMMLGDLEQVYESYPNNAVLTFNKTKKMLQRLDSKIKKKRTEIQEVSE